MLQLAGEGQRGIGPMGRTIRVTEEPQGERQK